MKIQNLAVIFIIIMLPISMVLTTYVQNQIQTLELQISYDTKLTNATYDALKAFQLNTVNSGSSDLANSKIRDIEASVNTFFNSVASNFNMSGYDKDILQEYVPAIVYTMYDGYYIYTSFTNTINEDKDSSSGATYHDGDKIYGLRPYVHYSCRYIDGSTDVVITYTLDNCITVEGTVRGEPTYKTGYLLEPSNFSSVSDTSITYRGSTITSENNLTEHLIAYDEDTNGNYVSFEGDYVCDKVNGVKYYNTDPSNPDNKWFSILTNTVYPTNNQYDTENTSALEYYQNALEFTNWVRDNLSGITTGMAYDEDGTPIGDVFGQSLPIFTNQAGWADSIEDPNSLFNQHRLAVIRYTIEKNLSIAIANYNNYSGVTANFQMPELKEDEWEKILNNVSIISFMQGLSIGGKIYNGYSIVTNTKTEEVVNLDSIYITTTDGQYHRATDKDLIGNSNIVRGYFNIDFERKSTSDGTANVQYYYPHAEMACYSSVVTQSGSNTVENIYEYMEDQGGGTLAQVYFTALGRERFSMFRSNPITTDW